ncbi:hypothetical protein BH11ACT5_BH11ACT5_22230 [soil metagenome]
MTSPGEVERVPLKVVPIYLQPIDDEPEAPEEEPVVVEEPVRVRRPYLGIAAVVLALGTVGVHIAAIVVATGRDFPTGTYLGYVAIGLSALTVVVGLVAAVIGRGRAWGIAAAVVGILANPWVLLVVLRFLSGLQTG